MAKEERVKPKQRGVPAVLLIGGAVAAAAVALWFATRAQAAPPPPTPGLANLYGKVTDADTGSPLAGVLVALDGMQAYTDSGGNYAFIEMEPGAYVLQFSKEGYETAIY